METISRKDNYTEMDELEEDIQKALYSALEDLAFFLKQSPMDGSFRCSSIRNIIKLALGQKRPCVNEYIMPVASLSLPMLLGFLAEWNLPTLEDNLLCAEAAAGLLIMFPSKKTQTVIEHCFKQLENEPNSVVDFSQGQTEIWLKLLVAKPLNFKLCMARGLLRFHNSIDDNVLPYFTEPITTACYQYSPLTCLGFRTLHMWLSHWIEKEYCLNSATSHNIYSLLGSNWENPVPGVRKEIVKVFNIFLDASCPTTKFTAEGILQHVMTNLSWKMKGKYFTLSVLIPKIGALKVLEQYPNIVSGIITTLGVNRLSYAGADVYRVCIAGLPNEDVWCEWFLEPIWSVMTSSRSDQRLALLNFLSRWLTPTLRMFPVLTERLRDRLMTVQAENFKVSLALSSLLHQGRKCGFVAELWPEYSFVEQFLVSDDEDVRKNSFGAVCKRTKKTAIPCAEEFEAVQKFLRENVNADNVTLRQSLVDSFCYFLERLHESSVKFASTKKKKEYPSLMSIFTFLQWLHKFLLKNLETGGNYQRKVTSLQLYLEVLKCFGPGKIESTQQPDYVRLLARELNMWHFESSSSWHALVECVLSPTDDIQKAAGVILSNHLKLLDDDDHEIVHRMEKLWLLAIRQCNSALFYEAESGRILMKLIAQFIMASPNLFKIIPPVPIKVLNEESVDRLLEPIKDISFGMETDRSKTSEFESWDDIVGNSSHNVQKDGFVHNKPIEISNSKEPNADYLKQNKDLRPLITYMHYEMQRQWDAVEQDLFRAVTLGTPLHGVLAATTALVPFFSQYDVAQTLLLIVKIADHYLNVLSGQSKNIVSPSFSEMTQAIDNLIPEDELEGFSTQLSPSHQLVLSCVWLTLKECCSLAAVILCHPEASGLDAVRCLMLVERILLRCRYKGTIEAAGSALAVMVRHVTNDQETRRCTSSFVHECGEKLSDFLQDILLKVLKGVTLYSNQTSITRRSAGVGILIQKLVATDVRPNKPLLQLCLRKLCETIETIPPDDHVMEDCDLPQACALHLLCRLVQDASLRQEIMPFASTIAFLCFETFSSPVWTVRNAALQLYGVLVPVLVGEKKVLDDDVETYGNLTSEEFFSHHPGLIVFCLNEMKKCADETANSKEIVPVLSLLSKLTLGDSLSSDNCYTEIQDLQKYLKILMRNSDLDVRKLAAKCFSRYIPKELLHQSINELLNELENMNQLRDNDNYGIVAVVSLLVNRLVEENAGREIFVAIRENFQVRGMSPASWISYSTAFEVIQQLIRHGDGDFIRSYACFVKFVLHCLEKYSFKEMVPVGVYSWATQCIDFALEMCKDDVLCSIWTILFTSDWDEFSEVCLCRIMERISTLPLSVVDELVNMLLSCVSNRWNKDSALLCSIYETLLVMMPFVKLITSSHIVKTVFENGKKEHGLQCWSVTLPLACEMFASHIQNFDTIPENDKEFLKLLAVETQNRTSADNCAVESRVLGAKAFRILFRELCRLHAQNVEVENMPCYVNIVSMVLDSGIEFLQDEDVSVRIEASKIVIPLENPYTCLLSLLSKKHLSKALSHFQIAKYFMNKLLDFSSYETLLAHYSSKSKSIVGTSPFDYGKINIYAEKTHMLQVMADEFLILLNDNPTWLSDLPALSEEQVIRDLVGRLLQAWKTDENGVVTINVEMYSLLIRLNVLVQVSEVLINSSKGYDNIRTHVISTLKIC